MAAITVIAELKFRNGQRQNFSVEVKNDLCSLANGINELKVNVSQLLTEVVEEEKARRDCGGGKLPAAINYLFVRV
uniref:Uncharacterized protein n=1 Tax=Monopterus albus TaxID=43700 RepID=A0A3Q3IEA5_MONAL